MISISVEGQELYILEDTMLSMELNNSIFNTERIEGDIIFTFDVPAEQNDVIFQHARYIYVNRLKTYDAIISVSGIQIAKGKLIIQSAKHKTYSCGVVMNPYPIDFSDKLLKDNDYGIFSELGKPNTRDDMFQLLIPNNVRDVIIDSLLPDSNIKFSRFVCRDFYADKNPTYNVNRIANYLSVRNNIVYDYSQGTRFTDATRNVLAPQIRLIYLLQSLFSSFKYNLIGDIITDEFVARIFYQSMQAMDRVQPYAPVEDEHWDNRIFASSIPLNLHVPNLSNAEFINTICDLFGCVYYLDSLTKTVEISFAKNLPRTAHIDLSEYQLDNEIEIEKNQNNRFTFQLDSLKNQDIDRKEIVGTIANRSELIDGDPGGNANFLRRVAARNAGKLYFAYENNAFYISQLNEDTERWEWVFFSGNNKTISNVPKDGNHGGTVIKPNAKIPTRSNVYFSLNQKQTITNIQTTGISNIFDTGTNEFDLILNYYVGEEYDHFQNFTKHSVLEPAYFDSQFFHLIVDGEHSIGQTFIKPYLKMLGGYEPITLQFLFPANIFLQVINLFKPQSGIPEMQTRWIMVNNVKLLPLQMSFEFVQGKQYIKCQMKTAKILTLKS